MITPVDLAARHVDTKLKSFFVDNITLRHLWGHVHSKDGLIYVFFPVEFPGHSVAMADALYRTAGDTLLSRLPTLIPEGIASIMGAGKWANAAVNGITGIGTENYQIRVSLQPTPEFFAEIVDAEAAPVWAELAEAINSARNPFDIGISYSPYGRNSEMLSRLQELGLIARLIKVMPVPPEWTVTYSPHVFKIHPTMLPEYSVPKPGRKGKTRK